MLRCVFDIAVGMEVYMRPQGNAARRSQQGPIKGTVTKIARKYFYVTVDGHNWAVKFEKTSFASVCEDCNSSYGLYPSLEAYTQQTERERQLSAIRAFFLNHTSSLAASLSNDAVQHIYMCLVAEGAIAS